MKKNLWQLFPTIPSQLFLKFCDGFVAIFFSSFATKSSQRLRRIRRNFFFIIATNPSQKLRRIRRKRCDESVAKWLVDFFQKLRRILSSSQYGQKNCEESVAKTLLRRGFLRRIFATESGSQKRFATEFFIFATDFVRRKNDFFL